MFPFLSISQHRQCTRTVSMCVFVRVYKKHSDEPRGGQESVIPPTVHSLPSAVHYTADPPPLAANGMQTGYEMLTFFFGPV